MIRQLIEKDREKLLQYLYVEGSLNIFIIGDVEFYGFDKDFQTVYGEFDDKDNYKSVLLFYRENCVFYSHDREFNIEWLDVFNKHQFSFLSGAQNVYDKIIPYFNNFKVQPMYFCEALELLESVDESKYEIKILKTKEGCSMLYDTLSTITEFGIYKQTREHFIEGKLIGMNMGITLFIEKDGKILSTVATTAETTKSAMVVAVATLEEARGMGLASILMKELMNIYFEQKKKYLCLFYDNPKAGNIYKRLGFKDVDKWVMLSKE